MHSHCAIAGKGGIDVTVRQAISNENRLAARNFGEASSTLLWCLAASSKRFVQTI